MKGRERPGPGARPRRFGWLLRLLPGSFREEYGGEILRAWHDEAGEAAREGRRGIWWRALGDTLDTAPREYAANWGRDIAHAARRFRRSPVFFLTAVITLALGTGATAAVFSLVNGVLLRPMPWRDPDRVGLVWALAPSGNRVWLSVPELEDLQRDTRTVSGAAGLTDALLRHAAADGAHEVQALAVSHSLFSLLGVAPALGRDLQPTDDRRGAPDVVMLSDAFWRSRMGADPGVVGRTITFDDRPYQIVGVMPKSFAMLPASNVWPAVTDVWIPLEPRLVSRDRSVRFLHVVARLTAAAPYEAARDELRQLAERVVRDHPQAYQGGRWSFTIVPFAEDVLKGARASLAVLFGLVVLVLLMACVNVANLLLASGEGRRVELALRSALGAGPARLSGELLAEAAVLAACGCAAGVAIAAAVPAVARALDPGALPRLEAAAFDLRVAAFMFGLVFLTVVLSVFVPLRERLRVRGAIATLAGRSGGRSAATVRLGRALVVVQTALATMILVTTVFLADTFVRLQRADLGLSPDSLLTTRITLPPAHPVGAPMTRFFDAVVNAVAQAPGVVGVGAITQLPLSGAMLGSTFIESPGPNERRIDGDLRGVTTGYFGAAGMRLVRGREFSDRDVAAAPSVAIVDETFARRLRPDGEAIGHRIRWFRRPDDDIEIVGVVQAVRHRAVAEPPRETVYRPHAQYPRGSMYLTVRTEADAAATTAAVRAAVAAIDPAQPLADVATMEERVARSMSRARTSVMLAASLAGLALTLAVVGLYGVLSFGVAQRRREFGVRMTLGATPAGIRRLVLREGLVLTGSGTLLGLAGGSAILQTIDSLLFGTSAAAVAPYLLAIAVVLACSTAAFWLPARRASGAEPMAAIRAE